MSNPSPPHLVPTAYDQTWASNSSVSHMVGRRLPRLYWKTPFAFPIKVKRAFSLPLRRLREQSRDVGAWMFFLMLSCWCLTRPLRGDVAGHRVTRQRIARYLGGNWELLHRKHVARCHSPPLTSPRIGSQTQGPVSIRRALHLGCCRIFSCIARVFVPLPLAPCNHATLATLRELHSIARGPLPSFVEEFQPIDIFVLDQKCFLRALRTSPTHSFAKKIGGMVGHFREDLNLANPAYGFDFFIQLASCFAQGGIPTFVACMLGSSQLVALQKPLGRVRCQHE